MQQKGLADIDIQQSSILIVDDDELSIKLMVQWLSNKGYRCYSSTSGKIALELVPIVRPDLILLDVMMPGMDGCEVASRLKSDPETAATPIILVTAMEDKQSMIRGLSSGAEEYLKKPIDASELLIRVRNILRLKKMSDLLIQCNEMLEEKVQQRTRQLQSSFLDTIKGLGRAADFRDDETGAHVRRISYYSQVLAKELGMDHDFCDQIFHASPLHDVGKIGIPDHILFKPGPLDEAEWEIMKRHTIDGGNILSDLESPYTAMGKEIALYHHERWDGSGYPYGMVGEAIPLPARIMSICDVYDALRSPRPYKTSIGHAESVNIILNGDGRTEPHHFDPEIHSVFAECAEEFEQIFAEAPDNSLDED